MTGGPDRPAHDAPADDAPAPTGEGDAAPPEIADAGTAAPAAADGAETAAPAAAEEAATAAAEEAATAAAEEAATAAPVMAADAETAAPVAAEGAATAAPVTAADADADAIADDAPAAGDVAPYDDVFPPTLREVMIRPRWIAMLLLCLVVAGVFAWLGQWQLARAITTDPLPPGVTEEVSPIEDVVEPGAYLAGPLVGQKASVSGWWIDTDFLIVSGRYNGGAEGYWVTGQFRLWDGQGGFDQGPPVSIAVAIGWAPTLAEAQSAAAAMSDEIAAQPVDAPAVVIGRLIADEGPALPPRDGDPQAMNRMSPAMLLGQWNDVDDLSVYRPYLVADEPWGGLEAISSPAPEESGAVNWLNIFYAAEWAVFAGFAFYLWYRLARDQWEREVEDLEDAKAEAAGGLPPEVPSEAAASGD